jgi:hypothetical protein
MYIALLGNKNVLFFLNKYQQLYTSNSGFALNKKINTARVLYLLPFTVPFL